jgi:hypothetical protein
MIDNQPPRNATTRFQPPRGAAGPLPPVCDCGAAMIRGELRIPRPRAANRVGAPVRPLQSLPVWRCPECGCQEPRIDT